MAHGGNTPLETLGARPLHTQPQPLPPAVSEAQEHPGKCRPLQKQELKQAGGVLVRLLPTTVENGCLHRTLAFP